jgi:hypothetical protein
MSRPGTGTYLYSAGTALHTAVARLRRDSATQLCHSGTQLCGAGTQLCGASAELRCTGAKLCRTGTRLRRTNTRLRKPRADVRCSLPHGTGLVSDDNTIPNDVGSCPDDKLSPRLQLRSGYGMPHDGDATLHNVHVAGPPRSRCH